MYNKYQLPKLDASWPKANMENVKVRINDSVAVSKSQIKRFLNWKNILLDNLIVLKYNASGFIIPNPDEKYFEFCLGQFYPILDIS